MGASSMEPLSFIISIARPRLRKCRVAISGYFVATRSAPGLSSAPGKPANAHPAPPEPEVEELVHVRAVLEEHVLPGDAGVGRAALDVYGHVGGLDPEEAQRAVVALEHQRAAPLAHFGGAHARLAQQPCDLLAQPALRQGDIQRLSQGTPPPPASSMRARRRQRQRPPERSARTEYPAAVIFLAARAAICGGASPVMSSTSRRIRRRRRHRAARAGSGTARSRRPPPLFPEALEDFVVAPAREHGARHAGHIALGRPPPS